ncbi:hypothetical protein BXY41_1168 [Lacrimispora xylanisolvens]|uniref:Uncharacterized protein n=1 Tax=Lacrimispora xylanisolvens TaxID=384636 RepID=A0A2S6HJ35_9FIRM|nr:hypothetical protein [Hungatella xylanolytica]PPK77470.1 hypothetical protein BXY41_1168 [Hungatella xylanolytica]
MAKIVMRGNFSSKGIQYIINQLERYKTNLRQKAELLCRRLAETGQTVALQSINDSPLGKTITLRIEMSPKPDGCKAILVAAGQTKSNDFGVISTLLLVEFGAGIRLNSNENPKAGEFGMGVGTYPGQIHAFDQNGWYYWGKDEKWHHTYGTKATMPMYNASVAIRTQVAAVVKEVFQ